METEQKRILFRIILSSLILIFVNFLNVSGISTLILFLIPYFIIGYDILLEALEGIKEHEIFDENFLMSVASIGALCLAFYYNGDYNEAVVVLILYQTGELFSDYAADKSRKNILALMDIRPDYANVELEGKITKINPDTVEIGTEIIINTGEKIPLDGIIVAGNSNLDTRALTGESAPKNVSINDEVLSGSINMGSILKVKTTKKFSESTASKILDLVENSSSRKSKSEKFITRFAKIYTPFVCFSALALVLIPSLIWGNFSNWIYRALTFLVISCPCALVISVPLTFFSGIGGAGRNGILIKGTNFIEALTDVKCVFLDKTGTLTEGKFDKVKNNSKKAVQALKNFGIKRIAMLTGDCEASAKRVAEAVGIEEYYFGLLPADKVQKIENVNEKLIFVGDGINDAPVLSRADVGIAMGGIGTDAAIEAADVVLMDDDPMKVFEALKISKKCMKIVKENIYFSIGVKILCLILGALGIANMWLAVFADVGVMILAVLNAIRAMF